jgi:hypothetical protein
MTINDERADRTRDDEYDDRMQTAFNGLSHFFKELDIAFPPDEEWNHGTRMRIYADAMKYCRVKMEQSMGRKSTPNEIQVVVTHLYSDSMR